VVDVVDSKHSKKGSEAAAKAYLEFLLPRAGQGNHREEFLRPTSPEVIRSPEGVFPKLDLLRSRRCSAVGTRPRSRFFAEGACSTGLRPDK